MKQARNPGISPDCQLQDQPSPDFLFHVRYALGNSFQRTQVRALRGLGPLTSDR
jgi:hypothetical protein